MRSHALALAGILTLSTAFNAMAAPGRDYGLISLPDCTDRYGNNVTYRSISSNELRELSVQLAMATRMNGSPIIAYDAVRLAHTPPEFQNFVLTHECAHHKLDHVGLADSPAIERDADCAAINDLARRKSYGPREIKIIADSDEKLFPRLNQGQHGIGWSTPDRRTILTACLKQS